MADSGQNTEHTRSNKQSILFTSIVCSIIFLVLAYIALSNDFTGDSGDSLTHYLYSHYSFKHPELFLNHWAKPLFVLFSSPFSQLGFKGIEIFNCLMVGLSCFFTILTAQKLKLKFWYMIIVIMFFSPLYFRLIFSGLTEYMFGLALIISVYLSICKKYIPAIILASFLPFIRSEGLIIDGVFFCYLLFSRKYKLIPLLFSGHLIYCIIGDFYYHDFWWVFTKIPYTNQKSNHGHGGIFDFVHILNYVIEKPNFILLVLGFVGCSVFFIRRKLTIRDSLKRNYGLEEVILIYGGFAIFFLAHSVFWWKGLFNSGGFLMPRVINAVIPLIALIGLSGLNLITSAIKKPLFTNIVVGFIAIVVGIYPFKSKPQGLVYDKNLFVLPENDLVKNQVVPYIKNTFPDYKKYKLYYSQPYLSIQLSNDIFDTSCFGKLMNVQIDKLPTKTLIIWDDWLSPNEDGVSLEALTLDKKFAMLRSFECTDRTRHVRYVVFKKFDQ